MKIVPLSEVCLNIVDCPHSTPEWKNEGKRVIRNFNIVDGRLDFSDPYYVDEETYRARTKRAVPKYNNIVFSREAPIGKCALIPEGFVGCLGQRLVLLIVNESVCSPEYLLIALQSPFVLKQIEHMESSGSIVSNFGIGDLKNLQIPIVDNQDAVVNMIKPLNDKIALNNSICSDLESMANLLYDYWFVQFDFPDENGRPYKSSGGKMVWNDELKREIPEGWEFMYLNGQYKIDRGVSYTTKDIESGNGFAMINLACVDINRNYKDGELKYYDGKNAEKATASSCDMLIACTDLTRNRAIIGCPVLVPTDGIEYVYSMDMAKISFTSNKLKDMYMYMTLRTDCYHEYIKKWASGTNVLHLDLTGLDWYGISVPPIDLQKKFSEIVLDVHLKKSNLMSENRELAELRDFLLPMLMNGQIKIEDVKAS